MCIYKNHKSTRRLSAFAASGLRPPGVRTGVSFFFWGNEMHTAFLIDGFNFYHSIQYLNNKLKWFDYSSFCKHFMREEDTLHSITYFTALANWRERAVKRHSVFIEACGVMGVNVVLGKFKEKTARCPYCEKNFTKHEEKATDVNIALFAYRLASQGVEKVFLITGDTDMIPAIRLIKQDFPQTTVGVIFPYHRYTGEMKKEAHLSYKTDDNSLENFILPTVLVKSNGKKIRCPAEWA